MEDQNSELEAFKARSEARSETAGNTGSAQSGDYEARMLEAFVGKPDQPEKGLWYATAFSKYNVNGVDVMKWAWSWWAFMGGIFFLLYRKAYAAAGGLFLISLVSGIIPFGGLIVWVLTGGFSTYFVYKVYKTKKLEIEAVQSDENQRIAMMQELGGYNQWVIWVAVIINVIVLIAIAMFASAIVSASAQPGSY
jgi:hypothetical protein